jgi:hypothetical protein
MDVGVSTKLLPSRKSVRSAMTAAVRSSVRWQRQPGILTILSFEGRYFSDFIDGE